MKQPALTKIANDTNKKDPKDVIAEMRDLARHYSDFNREKEEMKNKPVENNIEEIPSVADLAEAVNKGIYRESMDER